MSIPTNPDLLAMPFAKDGDKNSIPETTSPTTGLFSQQYGFQNINSLPLTAGGKAVSRLDFNGAMYMLSNLLYYLQRGYTFVYDDDMPYLQGCRIMDPNDGQIYTCTADVAAGTGAPSVTPANWELSPSAAVLGYRQPDTEYDEGAIAFHPSLPTGYYLECTTSGTTSSGALSIGGGSVLDTVLTDGTVEWTVRFYTKDYARYGAFNKKETFTTSGTFTAPVSGTYRITLQGGGGGGSGCGTTGGSTHISGGGGGQGGYGVFYEMLTAGTAYAYTIGAGGSAGAAGSSTNNTGGAGGAGGASSITINSNAYVAGGGNGGGDYNVAFRGGVGGEMSVNGTTISRGAAGGSGITTTGIAMGASGGGAGGAINNGNAGVFGGGGAGGTLNPNYTNGTAGGDGYITFEYCDV